MGKLSHAYDAKQHNLAMRGASSTGRILQELLRNSWEAKATAWREIMSGPTTFLLPSRAGEGQRMLEAQARQQAGKRTWAQAIGSNLSTVQPGSMQQADMMGLLQTQ